MTAAPAALFGREPDFQALRDSLASHRLVSIVGAGGIGKTALAQTLAHALRKDFTDGVRSVDLAPLTDAQQVLPALVTSLELGVGSTAALDAALNRLELRATATKFAASDSTDVLKILDRLMSATAATDGNLQRMPGTRVPSEIRSFISRWQLAITQDWQQRTLIDSAQSALPITIQVTQLRRRVAIAVGMAFLLVAFCIVLRNTVLKYRLTFAITAFCLLGCSFLMTASISEAIVNGTFWGLVVGLTVVTVSRWKWLRSFGRQSLVRSAAATALLLSTIDPCAAQQPDDAPTPAIAATVLPRSETLPDVLLPDTPIADSDVAYVRKSVLEKWQKKFNERSPTGNHGNSLLLLFHFIFACFISFFVYFILLCCRF